MFLGRQHQNGEDQKSCKKHLNEHALHNGSVAAEGSGNDHSAWKQRRDDAGGSQCATQLGDEDDDGAAPANTTDEGQGECDSGVEETWRWPSAFKSMPEQSHAIPLTSSDAEEDPCVDRQTETESQGDVEQDTGVGHTIRTC